MSLTSGMWTGVSGLINHGERMNVIGNNISNVNTVAFKGQRMDFADFIYQDSYSSQGITQIGLGVGIGAVIGDFSQGSMENTTNITDLAIGGRGFFMVQPVGSEQSYYTRAGNFNFDKEGYLKDPNQYVLQGWPIDNTTGPIRATGGIAPDTNSSQIKGYGEPTDIKLDSWTISPLQTTKVSFNMNLTSDGSDNARDPNNPFYSMMEVWDGTQPPAPNTPYLPEDAFSGTPATITVYDEAGATHKLTIYFDKVSPDSYEGGDDGETMWEYMLTMDPAEDMRKVAVPIPAGEIPGGAPFDPANPDHYRVVDIQDTKDAGILMTGTLTFDSGGGLSSQSAYVLNGTRAPVTTGTPPVTQAGNGYVLDEEGNPVPMLDPENTAEYMRPTEVSTSGFPMIVPNFTGIPGANSVGSVPDGELHLMEIDFGLKVSDYVDPWNNSNSTLADAGFDATLTNNTNPMITPWANPAGGGNLPAGSVLTAGDMVKNSAGDPEFYFTNPEYDESVAGSPPYIYNNEAEYNTAYAAALASAGGVAADIREQHWPLTGLREAIPPSKDAVASIKPPAVRQSNAFTSYSGTDNAMISASQNGYGFGNLTTYSIDGDGVLSGVYSNNVTLPLYQIALYDFTNTQGLHREGGNLYTQTLASGDPSRAAAGTSGFGSIYAQQLEGSNVDLSREFVNMIVTQRGYQSNSKVITTVDTMLETVISMKR